MRPTHELCVGPVVLQVLIAGGGGLPCPNAMTPASKTSYLINVSPGADHSIRKESMKYRRVVRHLRY